MPKFIRWSVALVALALFAPIPALAKGGTSKLACSGDPTVAHRLDLTIDGTPTYGYYALPTKRPRGMVAFAHGYGRNAGEWQEKLTETAQRDGVIAFVMDDRFNDDANHRGWWVAEGAEDTITVAHRFDAACPKLGPNVIYGVSMGGNTSGLAAAGRAVRTDGRPMFDYWFDIEGATNVIETYHEATAVAPSGSAYAAGAADDIAKEMGGPLGPDTAGAYASHAVVTRAEDIKASGIKGVVLVHGVGDGLVPYNQSREMQVRLRQVGIPTDFFTAGTKGPNSESGTTLDGYVPLAHDSPFAGHGSETSNTQLVIQTGLDRLAALYTSGDAPRCREYIVDGTTGVNQSAPAAC